MSQAVKPAQSPQDQPGLSKLFWRIAVGALAILAVAATCGALYALRYVLIMFIIAGMFGYTLAFPVNWLSRWMRRVFALLLVGTATFALLVLVVSLIIPTLVEQGKRFIVALPDFTQQALEALRGWRITLMPGNTIDVYAYLSEYWESYQAAWSERAPEVMGNLFDYTQLVVSGTVAAIAALIVIPILTIYFVMDGSKMRKALTRLLPEHWVDTTGEVLTAINRSVGGFILSRLGMALFVGVTYTLLMLVAGMGEYALLIGLIAFLGELVPVVGPVAAYVPVALLILATTPEGPIIKLAWVSAVIIIIQVVENYVVGPKLMGDSMNLHPLTVISALMIGASLGGLLGKPVGTITGIVICVPVAAVIKMLVLMYARKREEVRGADPPPIAEQI